MTLKDIAELAGVSMMTVSNVINGKTGRVSQKTMDKVNAIIQEYGYVPNLNARSLSNKTSHIIGVIVSLDVKEQASEDNCEDNYFENPYISTMIGTIEKELQKNEYYTMIRSVFKNADILSLLKTWNVDGIIILYPSSADYMQKLLASTSCPIATFDCALNHPDLINITSDDEKGTYLSTKYLIDHGHTEIAFVGDYKDNHLLTQRFNGYKRALKESSITFHPEYVYPYSPSYECGIKVGQQIASTDHAVTAVVTTADICAIGVMEGARLGGYRVPADLSVIGYDNLALCQYTTPKLTTVSQNVPKKARLAVQLLLEKIQTGKSVSSANTVLDVEIIDRQSVVSL